MADMQAKEEIGGWVHGWQDAGVRRGERMTSSIGGSSGGGSCRRRDSSVGCSEVFLSGWRKNAVYRVGRRHIHPAPGGLEGACVSLTGEGCR